MRRPPRFQACRQCRARVVAGLDNEWCGLWAQADPKPITAELELKAKLEGRRTYRLSYGRDGQPSALDYRDRWMITGYPVGGSPRYSKPYAVVVEHRCPGLLVHS
jgi:hypothetical protein